MVVVWNLHFTSIFTSSAQPAINPPILSAAISSPVKIPTTPEALSAFEYQLFYFALA